MVKKLFYILFISFFTLNSCQKQKFKEKYEGKYIVNYECYYIDEDTSYTDTNIFTLGVSHKQKTKNQVYIYLDHWSEESKSKCFSSLFCPEIEDNGNLKYNTFSFSDTKQSGFIINDSIYIYSGESYKGIYFSSSTYSGKKIE